MSKKFISIKRQKPLSSLQDLSWIMFLYGKLNLWIKRNVARWGKPNNPTQNSESANFLNKNIQHSCNWKIFANASKYTRTRKNLDAISTALLIPSLNDQSKKSKKLILKTFN